MSAHASGGSLGERAVRTLSRALGGARWSRRSFLVRTSLVGSALAVNLREFATTPVSAYDSVCGTLTQCGDPFTVFCCTINHGANVCPEGTFVGGWWKADRSAYCRGDARYYVDCNGDAGHPWRCHCPDTKSCDQRKVACNLFRYGNCNLEIPNYSTAVVCRVITCTPPWEWDPACNETSFTDQATGSQSAPCLPAPWSSPIEILWSDLGATGSPLGPALGRVRSLPDGDGTYARYRDGAIYDVHWAGVHAVYGATWGAAEALVGRSGIGYPADEQGPTPDGVGWEQRFVNRVDGRQAVDAMAVGRPGQGTFVLEQPVLAKWLGTGGVEGVLGYPTSSSRRTSDGLGSYATFRKAVPHVAPYRGAIYAHPALGPHVVLGEPYEGWLRLGGAGGPLGLPSSDPIALGPLGDEMADFAVVDGTSVTSRGAVVATTRFGTHGVWGLVHSRWVSTGAQAGPLGVPTSDVEPTPDGLGSYATFSPLDGGSTTTGGGVVSASPFGVWALLGTLYATWAADEAGARVLGVPAGPEVDGSVGDVEFRSQRFSTGAVYDSAVGRRCVLYGPILATYLSDGGPSSSLGLPLGSVSVEADGDEVASFQGGTLTYTPGTGVTQS